MRCPQQPPPGSFFAAICRCCGHPGAVGSRSGQLLFLNRTTLTPPTGVITAGNSVRTDTLADQSIIILTRNSRLKLAPGFATGNRQVTLEGEGYFSVKHQAGKTFTIAAGELKIEVVGTEFNVNQDTTVITVGVKQGLVKLYAGASNLLVSAGSTGIYNRQTKELKLWDSVVRNNFAYATRELYFYSTPLQDVKQALEAAYGVKIVFENSKLAHCRLNTQFNHQSIQQIMEVIAASLGIHYRIEQQTIYISGDECR
ncbi:FecR family protein [Paraflavitalea speifideaquila]|uniref:FecR family protein n=1 Tax=Paraflavitalea speifideaquila TaxID=3076558 RepID=UPI0028ED3BC9|nr:FecR family protein [Paraflavitalea speifideiaquila]